MPVELQVKDEGKVLDVKLTGKLTKGDYERLIPEVERLIKQHGQLRMLVQMHEFHGWKAGALWQDFMFDLKHFRDIERLALVGEKTWEQGMAIFCKPFSAATIRYFDSSQAEQAEAWIQADLPAVRETTTSSK